MRKLTYPALISIWICICVYAVSRSVTVSHPAAHSPIQFYATENGDDLQQILFLALKNSQKSLHLSSFGFNDSHILEYLGSALQVPCSLCVDDKNAPAPPPLCNVQRIPHEGKALMHKKIVLVDQHLVFLGSANLTPSSMILHKNSLLGIENSRLCNAIINNTLYEENALLYLPLPDHGALALSRVLESIHNAQSTIQIAMYVLTHPEIIQALHDAAKRGVTVQLYLDTQSVHKKTLHKWKALIEAGVQIYVHNEMGLLHHKCALIDHHQFLIGSLNWTKNGFHRNTEYLLSCQNLPTEANRKCQSLFNNLRKRCKKMTTLN